MLIAPPSEMTTWKAHTPHLPSGTVCGGPCLLVSIALFDERTRDGGDQVMFATIMAPGSRALTLLRFFPAAAVRALVRAGQEEESDDVLKRA
jgi:hypothetical protein